MATKFYLSNREDKLHECPIRVSISIYGTRLISTVGFNIAASKWDAREHRVKQGCNNARGIPCDVINDTIKAIEAHFINYKLELDHRPTIDELAEQLALVKRQPKRQTKNEKKELSWRDIQLILYLNDELDAEESMPGMPVRSLKEYCQTLLERYNEERKRRNKIIYDGMDRILSIGTNTKDTDE